MRASCWRGSATPMPGSKSGQFVSPHGLAVDSRGDIYVGEVRYTNWGRRVRAKGEQIPPGLRACKSSSKSPKPSPAFSGLRHAGGARARVSKKHSGQERRIE